jgi:predicted Zn-dependent protease with MMP-like domain
VSRGPRTSRTQFERWVQEALDRLPGEVRRRLEGVAVVVKARPGREVRGVRGGRRLLGLYVGTPLTERSVFMPWSYPDTIYIYQRNIEAICRTPAEVRRQVRLTVLHEVGHYLGLSEAELQALEETLEAEASESPG